MALAARISGPEPPRGDLRTAIRVRTRSVMHQALAEDHRGAARIRSGAAA